MKVGNQKLKKNKSVQKRWLEKSQRLPNDTIFMIIVRFLSGVTQLISYLGNSYDWRIKHLRYQFVILKSINV